MYSRKFPAGHPNYVNDVLPTDTVIKAVASYASGSTPALLSIPISQIDIDGGKVPLFLSGRITVYTGATPGTFAIGIYNGTTFDINHRVAFLTADLPANASGVIIPFSLTIQAVYDVKTKVLYGLRWGAIDPANNHAYGWQPFILPVVVDPNSMNFAAAWGFSQAPLSGTKVEVMGFGFGG